MILALALHAAIGAQLATPLNVDPAVSIEVATDQVSVAYSDYLSGASNVLVGLGVSYSGLARGQVGLETWPMDWIALRLDGGPVFALDTIGFNGRALGHLVLRIDGFEIYTGPGLDLAWTTDSARAKTTGDLGLGLQFRELDVFVHTEAGVTFTSREGTALVGRASLLVRATF